MPYSAPVQDMQFLLHHVLKVSESDIPGYSDLEPGLTEQILTEAGKIASEVLEPLNSVGDEEGCFLENGVVRTPKGFQEAFDKLREGGWPALDLDPEYGGQGMPQIISTCVGEALVSANISLCMFHGLTHGACSTIHRHGTEEQKRTYLPNLTSCKWTGTMNLTESHCGTDLGMMRTKAESQPDGTYRISGQKIFISSGDHDLSENIIHLVLAKIPGGPDGIKGVSLFIVPKFLVNEDGSLGNRNGVTTSKIEKKMGIHGNPTCVLDYDEAVGYLLGEEHKGMRAMFTMMNEARLGVGLQGLSQAELAYQSAVAYARERLQGRSVPAPSNPDDPADPIIVHPDIRRALMDQKAFIGGARAFALWGASLLDRAARGEDSRAEDLISLLTPVIKGFLTDTGFAMTVQAQQVYGGHGYIEETGMSQYARDARIAMIYEGANGIQALDLVGRKLPKDGGKAITAYIGMIEKFISENSGSDSLKGDFLDPLGNAVKSMKAALSFFYSEGLKNPNAALSGATDFLHLMGHVSLGYMWSMIALACLDKSAADSAGEEFLATKLATGRYYMSRLLPAVSAHESRIMSGDRDVMALSAEAF